MLNARAINDWRHWHAGYAAHVPGSDGAKRGLLACALRTIVLSFSGRQGTTLDADVCAGNAYTVCYSRIGATAMYA
jgi:hypothetical protein